MKDPWFKFFAADYLMDRRVDAIPREAVDLLIRMWCICHIDGSCPANPNELARLARCDLQYVLQCQQHCQLFFELQSGRYFSRRMQAEKKRSVQASENAKKRYKKTTSAIGSAIGNANGNANTPAQSQSQSQSQINTKDKTGIFNTLSGAPTLTKKELDWLEKWKAEENARIAAKKATL